jgi:ribA/ribD-fused uncharacterized protein
MKWQTEDGRVHDDCVVFYRVKEEYGGLSNMAGGYPLRVQGVLIASSEALYQACRFPHQPEWQKEILEQPSPMGAKMMAKKGGRRREHSRADWETVNVEIMRWVLRVKLSQHFPEFGGLLRSTGQRLIVEKSRTDAFWGAREGKDGILRGQNQLGRLLMELRGLVLTRERAELQEVLPPAIPDFLLLGRPIDVIRIGTARK